MKGSYRRILALGAAAFGAVLVVFELRRVETLAQASWFWIAVGGLMVVLGLIEVLTSRPEGE